MPKAHQLTKQLTRWLRALEIAKILFEDEGYHTAYLEEIEAFIQKTKIKANSQRSFD
jgi:hypothetical protein